MFDGKFRAPVDAAVRPLGAALRKTHMTPDHLTVVGRAASQVYERHTRRPFRYPRARYHASPRSQHLVPSHGPDNSTLARGSGINRWPLSRKVY